MRETTVAEVMTADVVTARPETSFKALADLLATHRISGVPVVGSTGVPLGVVSESDLVTKQEFRGGTTPLSWFAGPARRARRRKAGAGAAKELMSAPAITVAATDSVDAAARLMASKHVRRLCVVDGTGTLVGVVSRRDVLSTFLRPDEEIRAEITGQVLGRGVLAPPGAVDVQVRDGVVTLSGYVETRSGTEITCEVVAAVPGVIAVRNDLRYQVDDMATTAL